MRRSIAGAVASAAVVVMAGAAGVRFARADDGNGHAATRVVTLDVAAVDARGRAILNLKASDFELTVDGAPQPLDGVVAFGGSRQPSARTFGIFLDEYHTRTDDAIAIRGALTRFVDTNLTPADRVIVMKPLDSLLAMPAAKDLAEVRDAIGAFDGRLGSYDARTPFEREFMARSPDVVDRLRRQITVSALNALAVRVGGLGDGRKAILLVSEGFADLRPVRGEEALPTVESLVRTANRENVAIYALDPSSGAVGADVLQTIATNTDGRAARNDGGVDALLHRVAADSSAYYLLTCRPAVPPDGRFHRVQVRVKRPNVRVRTRQGFWAMSPDEAIRLARADEEAKEIPFERTPRHTSVLIRPWFGMTRASDGRTRVTFVWEPSRRVPGDRARVAAPVSVAITATEPDGSVLYDGTVSATGVVGETRGPAAKAVFDAAPGRLLVHMSIAGANAKELDVDTRDLAVRDLRQAVIIGTPALLRARTAREFRALAVDLDAAPVASREFSRAERLLVRFAAYSPADDPAVVSVRLVSRAGGTMRTFHPSALDGVASSWQIDIPLAAFAPGEYTIELSAAAKSGSAKELVTVRVTG